MRKSRFTEEHIIVPLTEQERRTATAELCRDSGQLDAEPPAVVAK
jgi:hypothetical protein